MKTMKDFWSLLRHRWHNTMPKFFARICWVCALISGTSLAINTAITAGGGVPHEWWSDIYPYLLGVPAGMAFVAKFTQNYDNHGNPIQKGLEPTDTTGYNNCDMIPEQPEDKMIEIEPYNDGPDA